MFSLERTEQAIEACYDAILAPQRWSAAMQMLGESLGAASCTFATIDPAGPPFAVPMSSSHEEFAELWVRNHPHAPDPHILRASCNSGRPYVLEEQFSTAEERRTGPYYQETARVGARECWAGVCFPVEGRNWGLSLYRPAEAGSFSRGEGRYGAAFRPQLGKLVRLASKFAAAGESSGLRALDLLNFAAMVVDPKGLASHLNARAQALLGPDLNLLRGRLVATDRTSNRDLQAAIALNAVTAPAGTPAHSQAVISREGVPWLLVDAMPITRFSGDLFTSARCLLILTDLTRARPAGPDTLVRAFGLSSAEASLADHLATGVGIDCAATKLGISRETARSQLKAVFLKTNTHRQAELANLIARLGSGMIDRGGFPSTAAAAVAAGNSAA